MMQYDAFEAQFLPESVKAMACGLMRLSGRLGCLADDARKATASSSPAQHVMLPRI